MYMCVYIYRLCDLSTRWSTSFSTKVNSPPVVNSGTLFGASSVTQPSKFEDNEALELNRVVRG